MRRPVSLALCLVLCWLVLDSEAAPSLSGLIDKPRDNVTLSDIAMYNNAGYVAAGTQGVLIYNLASARNPILISTLKTRSSADRVLVVNGVLYVEGSAEITGYSLQFWDRPTVMYSAQHRPASPFFLSFSYNIIFSISNDANNQQSFLRKYTLQLGVIAQLTYPTVCSAATYERGWSCMDGSQGVNCFYFHKIDIMPVGKLHIRYIGPKQVSPTTGVASTAALQMVEGTENTRGYLGEGTRCHYVTFAGVHSTTFDGVAAGGWEGDITILRTLLFSDPVVDIKLAGAVLTVVTTKAVFVYSVTDHNHPRLLHSGSNDPVGSNIRAVTVASSTYVVTTEALLLYDSGSQDKFVPFLPPTERAPLLASSATHVFKASSPYGIEVLDRNTLQRVGFYSHPHAILGMAEKVVGNRLYFASSEVFTLDVSNPAAPLLLEIYSQHGVEDMYVEGSTLYLACGSAGLVILDTKSTPMRHLGVFDTPGTAKAVTVSGTTAYIADGTSLQVVEVCDPASPVLLGMVSIAGARDVEVVGKTAYIADDRNMVVVDVKTPAAPSLVRTYQHGTSSFAMAVTQQAAFLTTSTTISTVDISSPQGPSFAGHTAISTTAQPTVHVSGPFLFIADMHHGLQRLTITDTIASFSGSEVGCLHEVTANNYILPVRNIYIVSLNSVQCASLCSSADYTHSGLRTTAASVECCCGEAADFVGSIRSEASGCSAVDSGRIAVRSAVPVHVGCYVDDIAARKLKFEESGNSVTVSRCAGLCQAKRKAYSGVQGGDSCYCGDDIGTQKLAPAADCSVPCLRDPQQKCGANLRNAISILKPVSLTLEVQTGTGDYSQSSHSFPVEVEYWDGSVQIVGSVVAPARGSTTLFTIPTAAVLPREVRLKEQGGDGWNVKHVKFYGPTTTAVKWRVDGATGMWIKDQEGHRLGVWVAP